MKFDMNINDDVGIFKAPEGEIRVYVDKIDEYEFEVRIGTIDSSQVAGSFSAANNQELNQNLAKIYDNFINSIN